MSCTDPEKKFPERGDGGGGAFLVIFFKGSSYFVYTKGLKFQYFIAKLHEKGENFVY